MNSSTKPCTHERGVSLIELLVGITIGLFVALAAIASLSQTQRSGETLDASVALHQDAAAIWRILGNHLRQTGAQNLANVSGGADVIFDPKFALFASNGLPSALTGINGSQGAADRLSLRFDSDPREGSGNCLGSVIDGAASLGVESTFQLVGTELQCNSRYYLNRDDTRPAGDNGALLMGVQDFQVRYAERIGADLRYVDMPGDFSRVGAVEVCLHLASELRGQSASDQVNCAGNTLNATDGRLHRVFRRVFQLRNVNP